MPATRIRLKQVVHYLQDGDIITARWWLKALSILPLTAPQITVSCTTFCVYLNRLD
jgi:hypothetical protein